SCGNCPGEPNRWRPDHGYQANSEGRTTPVWIRQARADRPEHWAKGQSAGALCFQVTRDIYERLLSLWNWCIYLRSTSDRRCRVRPLKNIRTLPRHALGSERVCSVGDRYDAQANEGRARCTASRRQSAFPPSIEFRERRRWVV